MRLTVGMLDTFAAMSTTSIQIPYNKANIQEAARQLWQWAHPCRIFAFSGSLGAGKTTFIHAICDMLKVEDVVSSPTFALINEYRFQTAGEEQIVYHMDWYRLRDANEAIDAGMEDTLNTPAVYCFVEWPEMAPELLHGLPHIFITLDATEDETGRLLKATRQ
jgi:tRNA threonylcarbamoyladenosine biosynthesis protein TsaE